jgi:hypothetical protein
MTGSRKVRIPDVPFDAMMRLFRAGKPVPEHTSNALYLEWFSETNGRVVIESADFEVRVSPPVWIMTDEQERAQIEANRRVLQSFLAQLLEPPPSAGDEGDEADSRMNEFEWERFMKESDARTDRYIELLEKYEGHPEQEKLVAREMGWTWLEEALEAEERGVLGEGRDEAEALAEVPPLEPNPATEGVDWVRDEHGHPQHPLTLRMVHLALSLWRHCEQRGLLGEQTDPDLLDMISHAQLTAAKLAGALNSLAYREEVEGGFVVASLKRALHVLHRSLGAADKVAGKAVLPAEEIQAFRNGLFDARQDILQLMERYRGLT